ncbi:alpha-amylase family glycosyl hydrolase [Dyadobacter endophyticus]|uniref:alpha-amylase family glycosyl hydrolase n=1 Tax=Dyadobacter endophyticus TaxID=1749036 RepID=UPI003CE6E1A3
MDFTKIKGCCLSVLSLLTAAATQAQTGNPPAVCYEIFVRSFADSNGDGIGDINGITSKLDYLKELGVDALWLTPLCKSPTYHKYDVMDYRQIDPEFGTMDDFKRLLSEAHKRKIRIIKDLVVNHTSDRHPWFQQARSGKQNPYRDYYVWLDQKTIDSLGIATREKSGDSWEVNPWHALKEGGAEKYYGLFWSGMPDLNFDNPKVREEIYSVADFWLKEVGVDGFRLDAAKHIYPDWEAEKSHAFWIEFREKILRMKPDAYLVGEVWSTPDKVAPYFKGLPANFNVDAALATHQMLKTGLTSELIGQLQQTYQAYEAVNPNFIDAIFNNNHDHVRIGTTVDGDIDRMKLAASLLLTLPGEPYLYYGEEIGMLGNKPDEHIREPFLWRKQAQDQQRTRWMKPSYSTDDSVRNLEAQMQDSTSLYHHYKRLIRLRHEHPALGQVAPANLLHAGVAQEGVLAFARPHASGDVLVIHNVSGTEKTVELPAGARNKGLLFASSGKTSITASKLKIPAYSSVVLQ